MFDYHLQCQRNGLRRHRLAIHDKVIIAEDDLGFSALINSAYSKHSAFNSNDKMVKASDEKEVIQIFNRRGDTYMAPTKNGAS